jgi:uncharacterized protein (DUF433 family)
MPKPHVVVDPATAGGQAVVAGSSVPVAQIVRMVAAGQSPDQIARAVPGLPREAVSAALHYAAAVLETLDASRDAAVHAAAAARLVAAEFDQEPPRLSANPGTPPEAQVGFTGLIKPK